VLLLLAWTEEVHDVLAARVQELCDQATVATPPKSLRAHEAEHGLRERCSERLLPTLGTHAGGIAAEGRNPKAAKAFLAWLAREAAAKLDGMPVGDSSVREQRGERRLVELRVATRAWKASNIDKRADARGPEHLHEFLGRTRPVPDRPHGHRRLPQQRKLLFSSARSNPVLWYGVQVGFTNEPAISVCQDKDDGGGCQAADLQQDEHDVVAVQGERTDEQAAEEPHHPGATTDARGTVFLRDMDDLWQ
jgi:hypothetical protein